MLPALHCIIAAPWPLPVMFQPFYGYWVQGPRKCYMVPQPDEAIERCIQLLDLPSPTQQTERQQAQPMQE